MGRRELAIPWPYNAIRDFRTVRALVPHGAARAQIAHTGLQDARDQAEILRMLVRVGKLYLP